MVDCQAFGVKIMSEPQGQICGNDIELPDGKDDEDVRFCAKTPLGRFIERWLAIERITLLRLMFIIGILLTVRDCCIYL